MSVTGYTKAGADAVLATKAPVSSAWVANTAVKAGQILTNAGTAYTVTADFTTPATFSATGLTIANAAQFANCVALGPLPTGVAATDKANLAAAITAAAGNPIRLRPGTYLLDSVAVAGVCNLILDKSTILRATPNTASSMFNFTGTKFRLRGGSVDGNRANQSGRPYILIAPVPSGTSIDIEDVEFTGTVASIAYVTNFGGYLNFSRNTVTDQAQHTGTAGQSTTILSFVSGQSGQKGLVRTNGNTCIWTGTPALPGSNPGGFFVCSNGYDATGGGGSGTVGFGNGNLSTWEAFGNYFYGYGQNCGGNDISPLHAYPTIAGARFVDNYFEQCGFSAISAKSVQDFVCVNNVVVNGMYSAQNVSNQGAILYGPGYQASTYQRPRAVITGNIIDSPGGQSTAIKQFGIVCNGTPASLATDATITGNVIAGCGVGISVSYAVDLVLSGNTVAGATGGTVGTEHCLALEQISGNVMLHGNKLTSPNGFGFKGGSSAGSLTSGSLYFDGNVFTHSAAGYYACSVGGVGLAKFSGNTFNASAGVPLKVGWDGTNPTGRLHFDESNIVLAGTPVFDWANITAASGQLRDGNTPVGRVTPYEVGTQYRQTNGTGSAIMWTALGTTSSTWTLIVSTTAGPAGAQSLLGWAFDGALATAANAAPAAGVLQVVRCQLLGGGSVAKVYCSVATAGTGLTTGQCFIGVYDSSGAQIGISTDQAVAFASAGSKTITLTSATATQTPGAFVDVALLWNGTTGPQLRGVNGSSLINLGISPVVGSRQATAGSSLTALPATMPSKVAAGTAAWFGLQ